MNNIIIKIKLIIAGLGNLIDAISTFILIHCGFTELNPFMAWLLQWPVLAVTAKIIFITGLLILIYNLKEEKYKNILATFSACLYGTVGIYYILWFIFLIFL